MPGAAAADFPAVVAACVRCGRPPLYMSGAGPQRTHKADGSAGRACLKVIQKPLSYSGSFRRAHALAWVPAQWSHLAAFCPLKTLLVNGTRRADLEDGRCAFE
ncbi:hypothetical protein FQA47_002777 [Oryzias melastigma]|uniref:Uncharacterized protein n=1 Tax=Oryzias melastigma TaxID=30732 RepID=A0A834F087_ORYME|nr:hypothetical protein FQA47_002777 [Oryzias melastigma]